MKRRAKKAAAWKPFELMLLQKGFPNRLVCRPFLLVCRAFPHGPPVSPALTAVAVDAQARAVDKIKHCGANPAAVLLTESGWEYE
eukprot:2116288-Pyramimonas_sp.AAC.1